MPADRNHHKQHEDVRSMSSITAALEFEAKIAEAHEKAKKERLTNAEIAKVLGVSEGTIRRDVGQGARMKPPHLESILRTIARINPITRYTSEALADAFLPHFKADHIRFLGEFLFDVGELMQKKEAARSGCAVCGQHLSSYARSDALYCSKKCRQKAHREKVRQVNDALGISKRRKPRNRDRSHDVEEGLSVTLEAAE